ncbi:MAG: TonB-dependent receptor [Wenzhouxiangellaceae bacterium]|nr:TonB-dependent receptor [Wenzhouxiangellaceae bacterium]
MNHLLDTFPRFRRVFTAIALPALLIAAAPAGAQDDSEETEEALDLDRVTVVAYRQPRSLSEVAGTVTILDADRIERDVALDLQDLVRYEPGVSVDGGGTRFGFGGFRIRGLGGNRTALVVDDVPAPDRFLVGNFADTGRGLLELGLAHRVEILRGPASTIYGSKALGGVVAVSLLDAPDLLATRSHATRIGLAGGTDADRLRTTAATAAESGDWDMMLAGAAQRSGEIDVADLPDDFDRDRQDRDQGAALLRLGRMTGAGRLRLTVDGIRDTRDTDVRALLGTGRFRNTDFLAGDDRRNQWRLLLDQELAAVGPVDRGEWRVWHQRTDTLQETRERRPTARTPVSLYRRFEFRQETTGAGADLETDLAIGGASQRLGYGFELQRTELEQLRFATQTDLETGETTTSVLGEQFPLRDFPRTRVTEFGAYLHDEIHLWDGGPMLSPGIRFEYYDLENRDDPLFDSRFPDARVTDLDTTAWTPRLGLVWPVAPDMELFGQYARGFRSPPFGDVNIGLDIPLFNIRAIANPDLDPEKGRTLEAGLRWRGPTTRIDVSLFRNRFDDFIETRAFVGVDPMTGTLLFQSVNRDKVRIEGAELRVLQALGRDFTLELAAEWLRGEDRTTGRSLPAIAPPQAIAALAWTPRADLEFRLMTTATRDQRRLATEDGDALFSAPGSTVLDLTARWDIAADLRLSAGLFNLTDERYWQHANVIGRPVDDPTLPLLAEPGTNVRVMIDWVF